MLFAFYFCFTLAIIDFQAFVVVAFVLNHPLVASTVFGVTKSWQLEEVISACTVELTSEIIADINKVHAKFPNPCP